MYSLQGKKNENGGEIRSMTTSQDNISDTGKHPQVNIKKNRKCTARSQVMPN